MTYRLIAALLIVLALGSIPVPSHAVAVDQNVLANEEDEARARDLMKDIRCLVCQNQSIDLSNAGLAKDLRAIVRERVTLGESNDQILAYMVDRYGDWILLDPPFKTSTLVLWLAPALLIMIALFYLVAVVRRRTTPLSTDTAPLSSDEQAQLESILHERRDK
jgi:cytochrome c-type biogenesis protein CcmH